MYIDLDKLLEEVKPEIQSTQDYLEEANNFINKIKIPSGFSSADINSVPLTIENIITNVKSVETFVDEAIYEFGNIEHRNKLLVMYENEEKENKQEEWKEGWEDFKEDAKTFGEGTLLFFASVACEDEEQYTELVDNWNPTSSNLSSEAISVIAAIGYTGGQKGREKNFRPSLINGYGDYATAHSEGKNESNRYAYADGAAFEKNEPSNGERVGADIANSIFALGKGFLKLCEYGSDTLEVVGTVVATPFTALGDVGWGIGSLIDTGEFKYGSYTSDMWDGTMSRVARG